MGNNKPQVKDFLDFIDVSTTAYHTVLECKRRLEEAGFERLYMKDAWCLEAAGKYYTILYDEMIVAFTVPQERQRVSYFKIIASHCDSSCFRIKAKPEMVIGNCLKLNTEVYGAPILNTWLDRTLSIAGKVILKSENIYNPRIEFIDMNDIYLTIPNLAIHLNKKVNEGVELNKQIDMLPFISLINEQTEAEGYLTQLVAEKLDVDASEILDMDLFVYLNEKGATVGKNKNLISAPRLDDLSMVYASIDAITKIDPYEQMGVNIAVCFNNEEIGNTSIKGADSSLFATILERITMAYEKTKEQFFRMVDFSFMISADVTHAEHINHVEKEDPTNKVLINKGITIKSCANKSYGTDSESTAVFIQLAQKAQIPVQRFFNRSDQITGKALGPIVSKYFPVRSVDVGVPIWAMHSSREVMGVKDLEDSCKVFKTFFES